MSFYLSLSLLYIFLLKKIDSGDTSDDEMNYLQIPIVSMTICGDLKSIDAVEFKLENEILVIIFKGSGGVADIISFAFEELNEK